MPQTRFVSNPLLMEEKAPGRFCRWDAPDRACSVVLGSSLIEELRRQAIQAYLSLPKRGAEIGGLLFGYVQQDGSIVFQIDGFEDIPCEYRFGPSYKLSDADYDRLSERLAQSSPRRVSAGDRLVSQLHGKRCRARSDGPGAGAQYLSAPPPCCASIAAHFRGEMHGAISIWERR